MTEADLPFSGARASGTIYFRATSGASLGFSALTESSGAPQSRNDDHHRSPPQQPSEIGGEMADLCHLPHSDLVLHHRSAESVEDKNFAARPPWRVVKRVDLLPP